LVNELDRISQYANLQSLLSLVKMKKSRLIQENQNDGNIMHVDINIDHHRIDIIFSENYYDDERKAIEKSKKKR